MKLHLGNIFHQHADNGNNRDKFPIGLSSDYTAIKKITRAEIKKWPRLQLQMLLDYCLSKEIFETAALIRDVAFSKGLKLRTS